MPRNGFKVTRIANAPREAVWSVVADARGWKHWAGVMRSSLESEGVPAPDGVGAIRRFGPPGATSRERVVVFEPPSHLGYTVLSGMPVRNYRADVRLTEEPGDRTSIEWSATFDPVVPGTGSVLQAGLKSMIGRFAKKAGAEAEKISRRSPHA